MAIMLLVEQATPSYEDRLQAYFPQFPSWGAEISARHLLQSHLGSSGIRSTLQISAEIPNSPAKSMASPMRPRSNGPWT
jgi:CubicO group peptidase (beta-lactamase class C family)